MMSSRLRIFAVAALAYVAVAGAARTASAQTFSYTPAGQLFPSNAGKGVTEKSPRAPAMRFPIESAPAYANSQVWGRGGYLLAKGGECDAENFTYPWHDNYCEKRDWEMPLCPGGTGHQGQDIRAASCKDKTHWLVAAVDGTIISASGPGTGVGGYQVLLAGADGTRYRYLHGSNVIVKTGQKVKQGERLALVSREFNGTPTTVHLHFDLMQNVAPHGLVFVPPYMSLVHSYERLLGIYDAGAPTPDASPDGDAPPMATPNPADGPDEAEGDTTLAAAEVGGLVPAESDGCSMSRPARAAPAWALVVAAAALLRSRSRWGRAKRR